MLGRKTNEDGHELLAWARKRAAVLLDGLPVSSPLRALLGKTHGQKTVSTVAENTRADDGQAASDVTAALAFLDAEPGAVLHKDGAAKADLDDAGAVGEVAVAVSLIHPVRTQVEPARSRPPSLDDAAVPNVVDAEHTEDIEIEASPDDLAGLPGKLGNAAVRRVGPEHHHVEIACPSWSVYTRSFARDLLGGGIFIPALSPPSVSATVVLRIRLPTGAKDLVLEGKVVHVTLGNTGSGRAGFGLELRYLTAKRKLRLQQIVQRARDVAASAGPPPTGSSASSSCLRLCFPPEEEELLEELEALLARLAVSNDLQVLGLQAGADASQIYKAYFERAEPWRSRAEREYTLPEVHPLVSKVLDRLQLACTRASSLAPLTSATAPARPGKQAQNMAERRPTPVATPPQLERPQQRAGGPQQDATAGRRRTTHSRLMDTQLKATFARRQARVGRQATRRVNVPPPPEAIETASTVPGPAKDSPSVVANDELIAKTKFLLGRRRFDDAIALLRRALATGAAPSVSTRAWLCFAQARAMAAGRNIAGAIAKYEAALKIDPSHEAAERELLIARCMV